MVKQASHYGIFVLAAMSLAGSADAAKQSDKTGPKKAGKAPTWTLGYVEDFPALTADNEGNVWLAVLARAKTGPEIHVYAIDGDQRRLACSLHPEGTTGLDRPAIFPLGKGCLVAFSAEIRDRWQIHYAWVEGVSAEKPKLHVLDAPGAVNAKPALTLSKGHIYMVWESNAGQARAINACQLSQDGQGPIQRISTEAGNNYNPAVVALDDGSLFAAWDTVRGQSADIYGAWCRDGQWAPEQRLTSDPRIERYVSLATRGNDVWLAWQAQSFVGRRINNLNEQRVIVAQLDGKQLNAPKGLFGWVSGEKGLLLRPRITFDERGSLWLTARRSMGQHKGWAPLAWCYRGKKWSKPQTLWPEQGRWRPVDIAFTHGKAVAAVHRDDLPITWRFGEPSYPDWHGEVATVPVDLQNTPDGDGMTVEPLTMPDTKFSLVEHMKAQSSDLPRQSVTVAGKKLSCYWGDLHEHTDMSVCQRSMNPPADDLYANERDIEKLDFMALTDHGFDFDRAQWAYNGERTRINHDGPRFTTMLGEEWTSDQVQYEPARSYKRYGHRNVIYSDVYFERWFNSRAGDCTPRALWDELKGVDYVSIPHQLADTHNAPTDWTYHDEVLQPVAEIFQARGSYEYLGCTRPVKQGLDEPGHYIQDVWAKGLVIGVIASPDHGGGMGKAGIWAEKLDRVTVLDTLRARHTFGTTGAKISLLVRSGDTLMGDKVVRTEAGEIPFSIRCVTDMPIAKVVLLRNNRIIKEAEPNQNEVQFDWSDTPPTDEPRLWYYVRIHREDGELAWSSPIWFVKAGK